MTSDDIDPVQAQASRNGFLLVSTLLLVFLVGQYLETSSVDSEMLIALGMGLVAYFGTSVYMSR